MLSSVRTTTRGEVWDLKHRPPFLRAFERFDPEGWGHIPASDIGDLMAQLRLPEAIDEGTVKAVTDALVKAADSERREQKKAAARAARRSGLDQALSAPRPFTVGSGEKTVGMLHFWRWHRGEHFQKKASKDSRSRRELHRLASQQRRREKTGEISKDWARRVVLAVGEREARLEAADKFRGTDPPRYVCPECNEYGCSSADGLDEHLRDTSWHDVQAALQETFEDNADLVAMAKRVGDEEPFPEYVQVARDLPEETELPVHEEPTEISRPLGTIKFDMLVLALEEEGEWLKINFESHRGVYVKHTSTVAAGRQRPRRVITRMHLPAARATAKAVASTAHLLSATATAHSTLTRPLTLAASGLNTLGHSTLSTLNTFASFALHGHRGAHEPEALAPGTAIFKPRVVRFVLPRVFCHAKGVPPDAMLKIRSDPGGAEGTAGATATATGESASGGGRVLGRLGSGQCVVALATSGDWLQVRYKTYEAAWMLMTYRGRSLMAPLSEVHPGLVVMVATEGGGGGKRGVSDSPFPMPTEVL